MVIVERRAGRGRRKVGGRCSESAVGWRRERRMERVNGEAIVIVVVGILGWVFEIMNLEACPEYYMPR